MSSWLPFFAGEGGVPFGSFCGNDRVRLLSTKKYMLYSGIIIFVLTYYIFSFIVITDKVQSKYTVISSLNALSNVHYCPYVSCYVTQHIQMNMRCKITRTFSWFVLWWKHIKLLVKVISMPIFSPECYIFVLFHALNCWACRKLPVSCKWQDMARRVSRHRHFHTQVTGKVLYCKAL